MPSEVFQSIDMKYQMCMCAFLCPGTIVIWLRQLISSNTVIFLYWTSGNNKEVSDPNLVVETLHALDWNKIFKKISAQAITALRPYCGCAIGLLYMLKQLLSISLMEVMRPGCPGNVESGETSLSWLYSRSIGSQYKIKDQWYCVWSQGLWSSLQVTLSIKKPYHQSWEY